MTSYRLTAVIPGLGQPRRNRAARVLHAIDPSAEPPPDLGDVADGAVAAALARSPAEGVAERLRQVRAVVECEVEHDDAETLVDPAMLRGLDADVLRELATSIAFRVARQCWPARYETVATALETEDHIMLLAEAQSTAVTVARIALQPPSPEVVVEVSAAVLRAKIDRGRLAASTLAVAREMAAHLQLVADALASAESDAG